MKKYCYVEENPGGYFSGRFFQATEDGIHEEITRQGRAEFSVAFLPDRGIDPPKPLIFKSANQTWGPTVDQNRKDFARWVNARLCATREEYEQRLNDAKEIGK